MPKLSAVYRDAALVDEIGTRVGIAAGQPDGKVGSNAVVNAHGEAPGGKIVAARVEGALHVRELAKARRKYSPAVLRAPARTPPARSCPRARSPRQNPR